MKFKKLITQESIELYSYVKDYITLHNDTVIGISTDSLCKSNKIVYATVVVLYRKGKGGHVLYRREFKERKLYGKASGKNFEKLYYETILSQQVVEILEDFSPLIDVNLDFNNDPLYFSNNVLLASMGWFKAKGVKVSGKPCCYAQVADEVVRCVG